MSDHFTLSLFDALRFALDLCIWLLASVSDAATAVEKTAIGFCMLTAIMQELSCLLMEG